MHRGVTLLQRRDFARGEETGFLAIHPRSPKIFATMSNVFQRRTNRFKVLLAFGVSVILIAARAGADPGAAMASKSLATLLNPILAQAKDRTVRILMGGTSIATFNSSSNQLFATQLKALYGDARANVLAMGVLGGSWDQPYSGWYKQPYSGPSFNRLRGDTSSLAFGWTGYGSGVVVEYSKEADGGACQVDIDGTIAGTIDCNGAQTLSVQARFSVPAGFHIVTFHPPVSGHVYLERLIFEQNRPGIEVIDGTLGGSRLQDVYEILPRNPPYVPGVPTQPGVGVASYFQRPDIDIMIWSGPVNDQGGNSADFTTWVQRMDEVVAAAGPQLGQDGAVVLPARPLILIAEMGGHYSMPADPYNAAFLQRYEYLRTLGNGQSHVYTVDWQGATADPDIPRYVANWYSLGNVVFDPNTGGYTGDFIHPNPQAQQVALQMECASLGIPIPVEATNITVDNRIRKTSPVPPGTSIQFLEGSTWRTAVTCELGAAVFGGGASYAGTLPLIFSGEVTNLTNINVQIAASTTADKFGNYLYDASELHLPVFNQVTAGERVTVTALVKGNAPWTPFQLRGSGVMYCSDSVVPNTFVILYDSDEPPMWVTFDYVSGGDPTLWVTGRLYSISVTRTNGQPVSTVRPSYTLLGSVTTSAATGVTSSAAMLNGSAVPNQDGAMSVSFDYGTSPDLSDAASTVNTIVASTAPATVVSQRLAGLSAQTVYYYRVRAMLAGNPTPMLGQICSFTTSEGPGEVPLVLDLRGSVNLRGKPGQAYTLEASGDLIQWESINSGVFSAWGATGLIDVGAAGNPQRFYRFRYPSP